ncbi:ABC transporter ATP-binding protein [Solilutibacter silvestris]|uniref:ABC-type sugar transport systems ATPase component n=1 Tax=Solilutibacter silvestris TaxID=1645665 RepID=A0A2K1PZJ0_9GAMM|nr:sn-glycerol-3-phosphate ABC transporter ATP-binding protein UgpC [Lysobacter silvestris]PNS08208.1 ABC-type sugar transport systems ATPase component [Lysobacter silvestris]
MASVSLDQVRKVYPNGHVAVEAASFEVADGERLVLVGPSGCGKSTLLRMIAGLEAISTGTLRIGERVVNDVAPMDRDIAMVFQSYALYPHMTVAENLGFALMLRRVDKGEIRRRVDDAAQILELDAVLDRRPGQLSGGQRQRVALGRALVREPKVFLLDEPLSNLDAKLRASMRTEIARIHARLGTTMVYVTHDQVEAMTLGQRIAVLRDGSIQQIDTPMALYRDPANLFVATFLGSPAMNVLRGRLELNAGHQLRLGDGTLLDLDGIVVRRDWDGREVKIGVRPEHVQVRPEGAQGTRSTVAAVEALGNETCAHLAIAGQACVARMPGDAEPPPLGATAAVSCDGRHALLFDPASGVRLDAGAPA